MVGRIDLLSDNEFKELIANSACTSDALRALGYSTKGNSWGYHVVDERMKKLGICFGKELRINTESNRVPKLPLKEILIEDSNYSRSRLRERLIEEGLKEYKCECCGLSEWMGKPISLQLHHLNGIHNDNRLSNLQILCPNCHSTTENFGTKGKGRVLKQQAQNLPLEDKKKIMATVREYGIVEARKRLTYRNSIINSVVKSYRDKVIMITPTGERREFGTANEAARVLYNEYGIGSHPESCASSIKRCYIGQQDSVKGFRFEKRSADL